MAQDTFTGTSKRGDLSEAIDLAVEEAKSQLHTDSVRWTLLSTTGHYGGFVDQRDLTATISAERGV